MSYFKGGALIRGLTITVTSGGTLVLTATSTDYQDLTGSSNHTVQLPDATTMKNGNEFVINNPSTGIITVNYNDTTLATTIAAGKSKSFMLFDNSTTNGSFDITVVSSAGGGASQSDLNLLRAGELGSFSNSSVFLKFNPEEIAANYVLSRSQLGTAQARNPAFSFNGFCYNIGGQTTSLIVERYNDDNNFWSVKSSVPAGQGSESGCFDLAGSGYSCGGDNGTSQSSKYNDSTDVWSAIASLPTVLTDISAFSMGGLGYMPGGASSTNGTVLASTYAYDPVANSWSTRKALTNARYLHRSLNLNNYGYVFGGENSGFSSITTGEKYSDFLDSWIAIGNLNNSSGHTGGFSMLGFAYAYQGNGTSHIERYSDQSNTWAVLYSPANDHYSSKGVDLNGYGYQIGSSGGSGSTLVDKYVATNLFKVANIKVKSTSVPSNLYLLAKIGSLAFTAPAQIRTDGDNWKNVLANDSTTELKTNENYKSKFTESGYGYAIGGAGPNNTSEVYDDVTNVWTSKATFTTARQDSAGFGLNGAAYLVGGYTGSPSSLVDKYNELSNSFTSATAITTAQSTSGGFKLNGYGFVVGGSSQGTSPVTTNIRYDDSGNVWTAKASLNVARGWPGAMAQNGKGLACGGGTSPIIGTCEQYNDTLDSWANIASFNTTRLAFSSFVMNTYAYAAGGEITGGSLGASTEKYDSQANTWTTVGSLNTARDFNPGFFFNGFGYTFGGSASTEQYNDASNIWTVKASTNGNRQDSTNGFTPGSFRNYELRIGLPTYIAGLGGGVWVAKANMNVSKRTYVGFTVGGKGYFARGFLSGVETTETERYEIDTNVWVVDAPAPVAAYEHAAASNLGFGYNMCGVNGPNGSTGNYRYTQATSSWTTRTASAVATQAIRASALNGLVYKMGGYDNSSTRLATVESFNDSTNAWTSQTSMSLARSYPNPFNKDGFIYVANGSPAADSSNSNTTEVYNDASNAWSSRANTNQAKRGSGSAANSAGALICGGNDTSANATAVVESYNADSNIWSLKTSLPLANSAAPGLIVIADRFIQAGGNTGSDTNVAQEYSTEFNKLVMSVALEVN